MSKKALSAPEPRHTPAKATTNAVVAPVATPPPLSFEDQLAAYAATANVYLSVAGKVVTAGNPLLEAAVVAKQRVTDATVKVVTNVAHGVWDPILGEGATLGEALQQAIGIATDPVGTLGAAVVCAVGEETLKASNLDPSEVSKLRDRCDDAFAAAEALRQGGIYIDPDGLNLHKNVTLDLQIGADLGSAVEPTLGPGDFEVLTTGNIG